MTDAYNAAEREHVREAAKAAKLADSQRLDVVRGIMSVIGGRAWMLELLERCHTFTSSFTGDALSSAFAEGERNIGLQLLNDIMAVCPDDYVQMMRERNERHTLAGARRQPTTNGGRDDSGSVDDPGDGQVDRDDAD